MTKERPYTGPTYAECMNLPKFPKLIDEFVCHRCGDKKYYHFSVLDHMATTDHSGGEDEARLFFSHTINDSLQRNIASEGLDETQHRLYCDELTRRVEAGAVLDTMETIELRQERAQAQGWQRIWDRQPPSAKKEEHIAKQAKKWCKGCHFPPALCGCREAITIHDDDDVYMEKRDKETRMNSVKCLRCDNVFAACKCGDVIGRPKAKEPVAEVRLAGESNKKHSTLLDYYTRTDFFLGVATLVGCVAAGIFVGVWGVLGVLLLSFVLFAAGGDR